MDTPFFKQPMGWALITIFCLGASSFSTAAPKTCPGQELKKLVQDDLDGDIGGPVDLEPAPAPAPEGRVVTDPINPVEELPAAKVAYVPEDFNFVQDTYKFKETTVNHTTKKGVKNFAVRNPKALRKLSNDSLTKVRRGLQWMQGHNRYPIIAMDDATPVYARALGLDMFGELKTMVEPPSINIQTIKAEVKTLFDSIESYPAATQKLLSSAATQKAQISILEDFKAAVLSRNKSMTNFTMELPDLTVTHTNGRFSVAPATKKVTFQDYDRFSVYLNDLKRKVAQSVGRPVPAGLKPGYLNDSQQLALDHAVNIKRLETYYGELTEAISRHRKGSDPVQIPQDISDMLARMKGYYRDLSAFQLKEDIRPATWTTTRLKWMQTKSEAGSILFKTVPKALDDIKRKEIVQYFQNLPESEKRALGIHNLVDTVGLIKRSKFTTAATGVLFSGSAATKAGFVVYKLTVSDPAAKEECAEKGSEQEFNDCLSAYLQDKFPLKFRKAKKDLSTIFNPDGSYKDEDILTEYKDALKRRRNFQAEANLTRSMSESGRVTGEKLSLNPESYRQQMIMSRGPEEFKKLLFEKPEHSEKSYLEFNYPIQFSAANKEFKAKVEALVNEGLSEGIGSEKYYELEAEIRRTSAPIADEIREILQDRINAIEFSNFDSRYRPGMPGGMPGGYDDYTYPSNIRRTPMRVSPREQDGWEPN